MKGIDGKVFLPGDNNTTVNQKINYMIEFQLRTRLENKIHVILVYMNTIRDMLH